MRKQRVEMRDYFDSEKELFDSYLIRIKKGEKISQSDINSLYKKNERFKCSKK